MSYWKCEERNCSEGWEEILHSDNSLRPNYYGAATEINLLMEINHNYLLTVEGQD